MGTYGHPYTPYDVQQQFMDALYAALSAKRVAIFESPTGTGKTLSLLGPAVAWLRDAAQRVLEADLAELGASGGPQWTIERARSLRIAQFDAEKRAMRDLVDAARCNIGTRKIKELPTKRVKRESRAPAATGSTSLDEFVLENNSGGGHRSDARAAIDEALALYQMSTKLAAGSEAGAGRPKDGTGNTGYGENDDAEELAPLRTATKIFFASRTHSQLAQVADALNSLQVKDPVRFIALGSRKQLCIHPEVTKLGSVQLMNEKCADLQKAAKCEFRHSTQPLRNQALGEIMDIEDLATAGREMKACPYYAAREALPFAEVVALPYPLLLVARSRDALGIDLRGSVVIIDEAHNLVDTVTALHSAQVSPSSVQRALSGLENYAARVGPRLSPANRRQLNQVIRLVSSVATYFGSLDFAKVKPGTPVSQASVLAKGNVDVLDLTELSEFVHKSKLVYKVESYVLSVQETSTTDTAGAATTHTVRTGVSSLGTLMDFLLVATDPLSEGKLFLDKDGPAVNLRYLVLDASPAFKDVIADARIVVLAGGTMEPMTDFTSYLLPDVDNADISMHSYRHIVPRSQLLVMPLSNLQFTFAERGRPDVIAELGELLVEISSSVPHGVIAFFPGYAYLAQVVGSWRKSGLLARLEHQKRLFFETNDPAKQDPALFDKYSRAAVSKTGGGALLLAVVGGRLSEGINFSDDLARGVVMVGLPFPNAFSASMVAKRGFIESSALKGGKTTAEAKEAARQYYENLAMRAVNQSVGRAIRHIKDYAAIYLIDARYRQPRLQSKLSRWVRENISSETSPSITSATTKFFSMNKSNQQRDHAT